LTCPPLPTRLVGAPQTALSSTVHPNPPPPNAQLPAPPLSPAASWLRGLPLDLACLLVVAILLGRDRASVAPSPVYVSPGHMLPWTVPRDPGGIVEQVKVPSKVSQQPLGELINHPVASGEGMLLAPDLSKFDRPALLHVIFHALDLFAERHGGRRAPPALPLPHRRRPMPVPPLATLFCLRAA
jgi:hypothetical protein